jgi:hypothetical protein
VSESIPGRLHNIIRDWAHRLPREAVIPRVRYRVTREGWDQVAEIIIKGYEA